MWRPTVISPAPGDVWDQLAVSTPHATVHQTRAWSDAIAQATGARDASRLYVGEDGRRVLLPLLRRVPVPGLVLDDSMPNGWGYGDLLADGGLRPEDVRMVLDDLRRTGAAARTRLLAHYANAEQWERGRPPEVLSRGGSAHVLDLDASFPALWDHRFHKSVRTAVRKAEKSGVVVERSDEGALTGTFYDVYRHWALERAAGTMTPQVLAGRVAERREPLAVFESVARHLGSACRQWVAWHDGEPVATLITLVHGQHAAAWRGYGRKALSGPVRAVNLLDKVAIEDACAAGCRWFSFGTSGGVTGLEKYKEAFGARPRPTGEYRIERLPFTRLEAWRGRAEQRVAGLLARRRRDG